MQMLGGCQQLTFEFCLVPKICSLQASYSTCTLVCNIVWAIFPFPSIVGLVIGTPILAVLVPCRDIAFIPLFLGALLYQGLVKVRPAAVLAFGVLDVASATYISIAASVAPASTASLGRVGGAILLEFGQFLGGFLDTICHVCLVGATFWFCNGCLLGCFVGLFFCGLGDRRHGFLDLGGHTVIDFCCAVCAVEVLVLCI